MSAGAGEQAGVGPGDLYEVMRCAPTTRRFRSDPVAPASVHRALENARFAPSGGNRQPWRVIVIDDPDLRRRLGELYLPQWERYIDAMGARPVLERARAASGPDAAGEAGGAEGERPGGVSPGRLTGLLGADDFARHLGEVPLHLIICVELASLAIVDRDLERPSVVGGASIYPFVQNLLLGLRREGLGAAFSTLLTPAEPAVKELLGIPDEIAVAGHVAVGVRAGEWPKRLSRRPVEEFVSANRFGRPWVAS